MDLYRIPNALSLAIIAMFYVGTALMGWSHERVVDHTIAGAVAFGLLSTAYLLGVGVGAGTVKLSAALILVFGPIGGMVFVVLSGFSMGVIGYLLLWLKLRSDENLPFLPFAAFAALILSQPQQWIRLFL